MSDLNELLRSDVASLAADAAHVPTYAPIKRRGVRRRRVRSAGVALAAAAVVASVFVVTTQLSVDEKTSPPVAPSPTPSATAEPGPTADEIVDHPDAYASMVVVAPENPEIRAVTWVLCRADDGCTERYEAVAVTDNGFRTRTTLKRSNPVVSYVGEGTFAIQRDRRPILLHADGTTVEVDLSGQPGPVAAGQVLVPLSIFRWAAVDPVTGRGHRATVPADFGTVQIGNDGSLRPTAHKRHRYVWSDNGGATWQETPLDATGMLSSAASLPGDPVAVLEGDDGATFFPLQYVHRSVDGGRTFEQIELFSNYERMAYGGPAAVLPDGRLLVDVDVWSDSELGGKHQRPVGLYISNGDDWSVLTPVPGSPQDAGFQLQTSPDGILALALRRGQETLASTDGGVTWEPMRLR
jgi:hypothetical protein